jgi:hypothetical protein
MKLLLLSIFLLNGCSNPYDRISELEKQTRELKDQVKQQREVATLDEQAKCGKDSRTWFDTNWRADRDTLLLDYTNRYNKALNKCLIVVNYNYWLVPKTQFLIKSIIVTDVYENSEQARGSESKHLGDDAKDFGSAVSVQCEINHQQRKEITFQDCVNLIYSSIVDK